MADAHQKTTLGNGLRIVTAHLPDFRSVSVCLFVGAGSRYEADEVGGISHFVEHLVFKGTERYPTSQAISEAIEGVGGVLNGATDREITVYWAKVTKVHFKLALDLLGDMARHSRFAPADVDRERQVITEEINMSWDSPRQRVNMLIDEVQWPDQPLGRDVAGSKDTVAGISREALLDFYRHQYVPGNTVLSVAGDIGHQEVVAAAGEVFQGWSPGSPTSWFPAVDSQAAPRFKLENRRTEQAQFCLALPGLPSRHPSRYALDLLNVVLGEGMSSRLFLELREKQGLAYDVHSSVDHYLDAGALIVYGGVDPVRIEAAIRASLAELSKLRDGVPEQELIKAKEMAKGRLLLGLEDTRAVAGWLGAQELLHREVLSAENVVARVDAVTPEAVQDVARQLFVPDRLNLAVLGPYRSPRRFEGVLHF